jgi:hypothetical protein
MLTRLTTKHGLLLGKPARVPKPRFAKTLSRVPCQLWPNHSPMTHVDPSNYASPRPMSALAQPRSLMPHVGLPDMSKRFES